MKVQDRARGGAAAGGVSEQQGGRGTAGGGGFSTPPGLAGRSWAELPPGIRKKVKQPMAGQSMAGCPHAGHHPTGTTAGAQSPKTGAQDARGAATATKGATATQGTPAQGSQASAPTQGATQGGGSLTTLPTSTVPTGPDDAAMEAYLTELRAGRADKSKQPAGFMDWVRMQLLRETGTDGTIAPPAPAVGGAAPAAAAAPSQPVAAGGPPAPDSAITPTA